MTKSLFQITADLIALEEQLTATESPESQDEIIQEFLEGSEDRDAKLDNYAELIQEIEARASMRKARKKDLDDLIRADENLAQRLKSNIKWHFEVMGLTRADTERHRITIAKNGGKLPLIKTDDFDIEALPEDCTEIIKAPVNEAIRRKLEAGEEVPGFRFGERGTSIRIK